MSQVIGVTVKLAVGCADVVEEANAIAPMKIRDATIDNRNLWWRKARPVLDSIVNRDLSTIRLTQCDKFGCCIIAGTFRLVLVNLAGYYERNRPDCIQPCFSYDTLDINAGIVTNSEFIIRYLQFGDNESLILGGGC